MVKEPFITLMVVNMKVNGKIISRMVMVFSLLKMVHLIKAHLRMIEWSTELCKE